MLVAWAYHYNPNLRRILRLRLLNRYLEIMMTHRGRIALLVWMLALGVSTGVEAEEPPRSLVRNGAVEGAAGWSMTEGTLGSEGNPGRCLSFRGQGSARQDVLVAGKKLVLTVAVDVRVSDVRPADGVGGIGSALTVIAPSGRDIRPDLANKVVEKGLGLLEMRRLDVSLEDIFHDLTTSEEVSA